METSFSFLSPKFILFFILHCLLLPTPSSSTTCNTTSQFSTTETVALLKAFGSVSGFSPSLLFPSNTNATASNCSSAPQHSITRLLLPSRNLSGTISWKYFQNLSHIETIDLSGNSLKGNIPTGLWLLNPSLHKLNISRNHFGGAIGFKLSKTSLLSSGIQSLDVSENRFTKLVDVSGFANLRYLDVSGNDLRKLPKNAFTGLSMLEVLKMKKCNISGELKGAGIKRLNVLKHLDLSENELEGQFPSEFPPLVGLNFLNISVNRFTGEFISKYQKKFGRSAFVKAGNFTAASTASDNNSNNTTTRSYHRFHTASSPISDRPPPPSSPIHHHLHHNHSDSSKHASHPHSQSSAPHKTAKKHKLIKLIAIGTSAFIFSTLALLTIFLCYRKRRRNRQKTKWTISKPLNTHYPTHHLNSNNPFPFPSSTSSSILNASSSKQMYNGPFSFEMESGSLWIADIKEPTTAAVIMFEKPLINYLTFKDLIIGTCNFGKESQLGEGNSGPIYRAVLPGELHVTVKVLEYLDGIRGLEKDEAVRVFEDLANYRHPNLLPISGYCIAGKEKLILNEFMPHGDLHNWLHELPPGKHNVDDWSTDTWDYHTNPASNDLDHYHLSTPTHTTSPEKLSFHTRHRIAVGIARGLAYLHHARSRPLVHGRLVPSNILLTDELEPRISDFGLSRYGSRGKSVGSTADDVYGFGMILIELFTGKSTEDDDEVVSCVRRLVRSGHVDQAIDPRLRIHGVKCGNQMVECLRVGYLCTSDVPGKRPTMQQVVGLLKDVNPSASYC